MKILSQIINKKLELSEEFKLNRQYIRSIWQFYCCYNLSLSVLGKVEDEELSKKRNRLWKKLFLTQSINNKSFKKIQKFMKEDMGIIIEALNLIDKQSEEMAYEIGDIDKPNSPYIGMLSYEFPT